MYSVEEKLQTGEEWAQLGGKVMSIKRFNEYVLKQRNSYQIFICNPSSFLFFPPVLIEAMLRCAKECLLSCADNE